MVGEVVAEREDELVAGLTNAIKRGESLEIARISFLNAGYSPQIVDMAVRRIMGLGGGATTPPLRTVSNVDLPKSNLGLYAQRPAPVTMQGQPMQQGVGAGPQKRYSHSPVPYWAIIFMLLFSLMIVIGGGVLGLYWDKLFS